MKQCNSCGEWKEEEDFNWRYKSLGIRHPTCKECQRGFRRNWYEGSAKERHLANVKERKVRVREESKEFIYQDLLTHPCVTCGETDPVVLEFHHVGEKDMDIAQMAGNGYSFERIRAELAETVVLFANCHRKLTAMERGWFRGKK